MAEEKKVNKLIEEIEKLSVLELNDLVKALEEKFGVTAMAPVAAPAATGAAQAATAAEGGEAAQKAKQLLMLFWLMLVPIRLVLLKWFGKSIKP